MISLGAAITTLGLSLLVVGPAIADPPPARPTPGDVAADPTEHIVVISKRLTRLRRGIQTRTGATVYTLDHTAIRNQPGGDDVALSQTLLQAPGVSQDSFGQIHLRNDHANIQYRIDGIILPEGVSFFGQSLTSRFAASIDLITGSLPAQYGLVTTGIVDIQTKSGAAAPGGSIGLYGGFHGWLEPSAEYAGHAGNLNYYVAGDYMQNRIGIENPAATTQPLHDDTEQGHGFLDAEDMIDATSTISAIFGVYRGAFQIPDSYGQPVIFADGTARTVSSATLNEHQTESNDYGVLSYLKAGDDYGIQLSAFLRYSGLTYRPDQIGDLEFYGLSQQASRADRSAGLQLDGSDAATRSHTIRYGLLFTAERAVSRTDSLVFPCISPDCSSAGTTPRSIFDGSFETGHGYSVYLQDEWNILQDVTLNYGVRYDLLNAYTDAQQLSPRINAVWRPDDDTAVHAGYSRYFTPPSLELISGRSIGKFAGTTGYPAGYMAAAPPRDGAILPERAHYADIGADHVLLPGLKFGVDFYWKIARDLIDEGQFGAPIILSVFNYAHANVVGAEFTGSYDVGNVSAYGNLAIGRERATQVVSQQFNFAPQDLAYIADHYIYTDHSQVYTASAGASYTRSGTRLTADMIYGSGLREDAGNVPNGGVVTPYFQLNLGATHAFADVAGMKLAMHVAIINVTDRAYEIRSGSGVGVFAPQYGPRRAFYAGLRTFF